MICGNCCRYIKLKCIFFLQIITSTPICKKKEPMIHTCTPPKNTYNTSIMDSEEDYGYYYDTEFDRFNDEKPITQELDTYDDAYEEYLDRYENAINYEDLQINLLYDTQNTFYNKVMEKGLLISVLQYIFNLCNFNN